MTSARVPRIATLTAAVAASVLAGCAGYTYHSDGMRYAAEGKHDAAVSMLKTAANLDPTNAQYKIDLLDESTRFAAELVARAEEARRSGRPGDAADLYGKALKIEPSNERALRGKAGLDLDRRNAKLLADADSLAREGRLDAAREKIDTVLTGTPGDPQARAQLALIDAQLEKMREAKSSQAAAQSVMNKPVTLQFRDANLRMVFEALSRTTGLNVILDRDVRADLKTTIFVKDAAVEDTVDLILLQNQLEKRSLNANTLFVYPATAAKQKEYQDLQVRTFQVMNGDVKYLQTVLKTVLKIKEVSMDERSNTLVIRDTPEAIAVAAKVIAAHDQPESEVMLEVQVLEVAHDRLSDLGLAFPNQLTLSTPPSVGTLSDLRNLKRGQLLVSPLALGINFKLEDTDANLLASPRIRARNKEKARILIGDRVPIITNSVTPVASGSSVVTGSVSYQDVGLKLEFEPQIYSSDEVGIRISLEVSTIAKEIPGPNGSLAYQIGTRNAQTAVRLRDGETQILGGLISSEDRNTAAKIPGLGHLPVMGQLFGNNNGTVNKTEIILSITPHILRPPATLEASVREVFSGTESGIRERSIQLDPVGAVRMQSVGGSAPAAAVPAPSPLPQPGSTAPGPISVPPPKSVGQEPAPIPTPPKPVSQFGSGSGAPGATPPVGAEAYVRSLMPLMNGRRNGANAVAVGGGAINDTPQSAASEPRSAQ
ncbi:MAG: secretion protein [Pseudomonadota bacterium]|nr:secretion protein [Pseudomonadota bacterium]